MLSNCDAFFFLNICLAGRPLVLKVLVKRQPVDILGPPLSPAREEDLFRVLWQVVTSESPEDTLRTCF